MTGCILRWAGKSVKESLFLIMLWNTSRLVDFDHENNILRGPPRRKNVLGQILSYDIFSLNAY